MFDPARTDGRSKQARRFRDIVNELLQLVDPPSVQQTIVARRIAGIAALIRPSGTPMSGVTRHPSAVTAGNRLFADRTIDMRSEEALRFRDILAEIISDLGTEGFS
jgi:hypothetical protein